MVACQAPLSVGFSRQEYWSGLPCPPPEDLPDLGINPMSVTFPALAGGVFTTSATWEALFVRLLCAAPSAHCLAGLVVQLLSHVQLFVTLWTAARSTPGFPVIHHLPEIAQTHVH